MHPSKDAVRPTSQTFTDRDRFIGFAFAAAHLLIEINAQNIITFAAGARCGLVSTDIAELTGRPVSTLVLPEDRSCLSAILSRLDVSGRADPTPVRLLGYDGQSLVARIGGCRLPGGDGMRHLSVLMTPTASAPRVASLEEMLEGLESRLAAAAARGEDRGLTLVAFDGAHGLARQLPSERLAEVRETFEAYLRAVSDNGDGAARLGEGLYAVLHGAGVDEAAIRRFLANLLPPAGRDAGPRVWQMDLPTGPTGPTAPRDAARALAYVLQSFAAEGPEALATKTGNSRSFMADVSERVAELRRMIDERRFSLVFQPIVRVQDGALHHVEALSRFERGANTQEIITFAERVGMIPELDLAVFHAAARAISQARAPGLLPPRVAVNVSAASLARPGFTTRLLALASAEGVSADRMMVELTETASVPDLRPVASGLEELKAYGFATCLDDVGAGTTSFAGLSALAVDLVKIDGSLVRAAVKDDRDLMIFASVVEMCRRLGRQVVGEHVETSDHRRLLARHGVMLAQGWLYGQPTQDLSSLNSRSERTLRAGAA